MSKRKTALFQSEFIDDLKYWVKTDRKIAIRIIDLVEEILRDPFRGIGKPESLKYLAENVWSRRITQEHSLVYLIKKTEIHFLQCRYHY